MWLLVCSERSLAMMAAVSPDFNFKMTQKLMSE
uniref:Uncharacterized protein n=1 Tax=Anguilla anguilla TaxID=7936 RepID=A0A0E9VEV4_ANGAN